MSSVLTFLKKLGTIIVNVAGVAAGVGPLIAPITGSGKASQVLGTAVNDLTSIGQLVVLIEAAFPASGSGPQKLQSLVPLVANVIKTSELLVGKQVADNELFIKGCTGVAQGVVDVLNSLNSDAAAHAS